jgi:hypothetical protein
LIVSCIVLRDTFIFLKNSERAKGTVTKIEREEIYEEPTQYNPIFTFRTQDGQEVTTALGFSDLNAGYKLGYTAIFAYDPKLPRDARLLTFWGIFSWPVLFAAFGIPLFVIGGWYFLAQTVLK